MLSKYEILSQIYKSKLTKSNVLHSQSQLLLYQNLGQNYQKLLLNLDLRDDTLK